MTKKRVPQPRGRALSSWIGSLLFGLLVGTALLADQPLDARISENEKIERLEQQLASATGRERLEVLLELMRLLRGSAPTHEMVYGTEALALLAVAPNPGYELEIYRALCAAAWSQASFQEAVASCERSVDLARQLEDLAALAASLDRLAHAVRRLGDHHRALALANEAVELFNLLGDHRGRGSALNSVGYAYHRLGDLAAATTHFLLALEAFEAAGDRAGIGKSLRNVGTLYLDSGLPEKAQPVLEWALEIQRQLDNRVELGKVLATLGTVRLQMGQRAEGLDNLEEALRFREQADDRSGIAIVLSKLGEAHADIGALEQAQRYYEQALRIHQDTGDLKREAEDLTSLGSTHRQLGAAGRALELVQTAVEIATRIEARPELMAAYRELAETRAAVGQEEEAIEAFRQYDRLRDEILTDAARRSFAEAQVRFEEVQDRLQTDSTADGVMEPKAASTPTWLLWTALVAGGGLFGLGFWVRGMAGVHRWRATPDAIVGRADANEAAAVAPGGAAVQAQAADRSDAVMRSPLPTSEAVSPSAAPATPGAETPAIAEAKVEPQPTASVRNPLARLGEAEGDAPRFHLQGLGRYAHLTLEIAAGESTLGRSPEADIVVPPPDVSWLHARLRVSEVATEIEDLDSSNGTRVNGRPVDSCPLVPGDRVAFGTAEFRLDPWEDRDGELGIVLAEIPPPEAPTNGDGRRQTTVSLRRDAPRQLAFPSDYVVGSSAAITNLYESMEPLLGAGSTVLIEGETGVGKELVAQVLQRSSIRRHGPFIPVNCAAIPSELLEAEMFGIRKGVATGVSERKGWFRAAEGGTLFLDEIGEMPMQLQAKLLRAVQEKRVQPVGGTEVGVDVWVIAATNRDLTALIDEGKFRSDLFYRLAGAVLRVPPLRERGEDLCAFLEHFMRKALESEHRTIRGISRKTLDLLQLYDWPGNVRELQNEMRRLVNQAVDGHVIDSRMLSERIRKVPPATDPVAAASKLPGDENLKRVETHPDLKESLRMRDHVSVIERKLILKALAEAGQSQRQAARLLGISRTTLARRIQDLSIDC